MRALNNGREAAETAGAVVGYDWQKLYRQTVEATAKLQSAGSLPVERDVAPEQTAGRWRSDGEGG